MNERPRGPHAGNGDDEPELARLYRQAAHEEPPQHLDELVLAAARREAGARPRTLELQDGMASSAYAAKGARGQGARLRAWRIPFAVAAVVMLAVSIVALDPELRAPKPEAASTPQIMRDSSETAGSASPSSPEVENRDSQTAGKTSEHPRSAGRAMREERLQGSTRSPAGVESPREAAPERHAPQAFGGLEARKPALAAAETDSVALLARQYADEPPEKWGEKIMALRRQGETAEADALLAAFRQRFPGYAIPPEWTQ